MNRVFDSGIITCSIKTREKFLSVAEMQVLLQEQNDPNPNLLTRVTMTNSSHLDARLNVVVGRRRRDVQTESTSYYWSRNSAVNSNFQSDSMQYTVHSRFRKTYYHTQNTRW